MEGGGTDLEVEYEGLNLGREPLTCPFASKLSCTRNFMHDGWMRWMDEMDEWIDGWMDGGYARERER